MGTKAFDTTSGMMWASVVSMESTRSQMMFLYVPLDCSSTEPKGMRDSFTVSLRRMFASTSKVAAWESVVEMLCSTLQSTQNSPIISISLVKSDMEGFRPVSWRSSSLFTISAIYT